MPLPPSRREGLPLSHHLHILINRWPAQSAHPRQLTHIHLSIHKRLVVPEKHRWYIVLCGWPSANPLALALGVLHPTFHPGAYHRQLQLTEHPCHLQECFAHWVGLSASAINGDAPHNDQSQMLFANYINNFTELLCASGQSADLQGDDGSFIDIQGPGVVSLSLKNHRLCLLQILKTLVPA